MTDETKHRRRMKRAPRPTTVVHPELVEDDDFGTSEPAPLEETETVIVSRGIILAPHPTETRVLRMGEDGKPVLTPRQVRYRPGCEITLPVAEAKRFIANGTVTRPGENPQVGPHPDLLVLPDRPEDPDTVQGERGPVVHALDADGKR
jgi:hypothetical protein